MDTVDRLRQVLSQVAAGMAKMSGADFRRLMRHMGNGSSVSSEAAERDRSEEAVGVWSRPVGSSSETPFRRGTVSGERFSDWADVKSVVAKSAGRRILLLGESAARGYLLDPHWTPAGALAGAMRRRSGKSDFEVVDLARTDILLTHLEQLTEEAAILRPQALVILAGNNWHLSLESPTYVRDCIITAISEGYKWNRLTEAIDLGLTTAITWNLHGIVRTARRCGCPLIFIIPGFNSFDWRSSSRDPFGLSAAEMHKWWELRRLGDEALAREEWATATDIGSRLLALDAGSSAAGYNIGGAAAYRLGNICEAASLLRQAKDVARCSLRPDTPRCFDVVQDTIRALGLSEGFTVVDAAAVLRDKRGVNGENRYSYFDYCHLTSSGISALMDAAAQCVLRELGEVDATTHELPDAIAPAHVEAEAHMLAAIHNARWGQPDSIVRYHCRQATELWPGVSELVTVFGAFGFKRNPWIACASFTSLGESTFRAARKVLLGPASLANDRPLPWNFLDVFRQVDPKTAVPIDTALGAEHDVAGGTRNLLELRYSSESWHDVVDQPGALFRAHVNPTRLRFVTQLRADCVFTLCCRSRFSSATVRLELNGWVASLNLQRGSWVNVKLLCPAEAVVPGVNVVSLWWPEPEWNTRAWSEALIDYLQIVGDAPWTPAFGEVSMCSVRRRRQAEACAEGFRRA